jgi:hypothetical protein
MSFFTIVFLLYIAVRIGIAIGRSTRKDYELLERENRECGDWKPTIQRKKQPRPNDDDDEYEPDTRYTD